MDCMALAKGLPEGTLVAKVDIHIHSVADMSVVPDAVDEPQSVLQRLPDRELVAKADIHVAVGMRVVQDRSVVEFQLVVRDLSAQETVVEVGIHIRAVADMPFVQAPSDRWAQQAV